MKYDQDDFDKFMADQEESVFSAFLDKHRDIETKWLEFCWERFEIYRQSSDEEIYDS